MRHDSCDTAAWLPQAEYWRYKAAALKGDSDNSPVAAAVTSSSNSSSTGNAPPSTGTGAAVPPKDADWVLYANDVEGSAFSDHPADPLGSSSWNLKVKIMKKFVPQGQQASRNIQQ